MPAQGGGCWSGYAFTYADNYGTLVVPTYPAPGFSTCGAPCVLKITGNLVAVSGSNLSYAGLGFDLGQPAGSTTNQTVTPKGSGLTFNFANSAATGVVLRANLTDGSTTWCTDVSSSPAVVPYSTFHVNCFSNPPGAAYAKEPINAIQMTLVGGPTSSAINLTLTSVTEN